ncbi:hypothetical protein PHAVU_002G093600, partial [Phaseolus vulgaris]|uniref:Uncharacterized protein n=1 Tax=Phaseolus vulgaris TaxID=3885 RepID=V7CHY6_PHAVU|nr:hypothetical protein PHAVU_002G093600g [Phaseolus vulgaris]ESW29724.1 hypothetical protein PHAVU_002G093600g [Phaseolus vulgaris]
MPPSPALRFSPGKKPRANSHKRGHSLENDLEDSFSTKLKHISDVNPGISIPGQGESSELLNDGDKSDYDWLLAPRDTPMFPSLDDEPSMTSFGSRGRPQSKPIAISRSSTMDKSHRSSRGSTSLNRLSPSPRSGTNTLIAIKGRPNFHFD